MVWSSFSERCHQSRCYIRKKQYLRSRQKFVLITVLLFDLVLISTVLRGSASLSKTCTVHTYCGLFGCRPLSSFAYPLILVISDPLSTLEKLTKLHIFCNIPAFSTLGWCLIELILFGVAFPNIWQIWIFDICARNLGSNAFFHGDACRLFCLPCSFSRTGALSKLI